MITGNETAMPCSDTISPDGHRCDPLNMGLTIRQHFAAMAMQGLWQSTTDANYENYERIAEMAVKQADALIAELNKNPNP